MINYLRFVLFDRIQYNVRCFFCYHDNWSIGVRSRHKGHYGSINHAKSRQASYSERENVYFSYHVTLNALIQEYISSDFTNSLLVLKSAVIIWRKGGGGVCYIEYFVNCLQNPADIKARQHAGPIVPLNTCFLEMLFKKNSHKFRNITRNG